MIDHKPLIEKLNKTGAALVSLCGDDDSERMQEMLDEDNKHVEEIRNAVRERSNSIEEALQQSAEVSFLIYIIIIRFIL